MIEMTSTLPSDANKSTTSATCLVGNEDTHGDQVRQCDVRFECFLISTVIIFENRKKHLKTG